MSKKLLKYNEIEKKLEEGSEKKFSWPSRNPAFFARRIGKQIILAGQNQSDKVHDFPDYVDFPYAEFKRAEHDPVNLPFDYDDFDAAVKVEDLLRGECEFFEMQREYLDHVHQTLRMTFGQPKLRKQRQRRAPNVQPDQIVDPVANDQLPDAIEEHATVHQDVEAENDEVAVASHVTGAAAVQASERLDSIEPGFAALALSPAPPMPVHSTPLRFNQVEPVPALGDPENGLVDMGFGPEDPVAARREAEQHFNYTIQPNLHVSQLSNILATDNSVPVQQLVPNEEDVPIQRRPRARARARRGRRNPQPVPDRDGDGIPNGDGLLQVLMPLINEEVAMEVASFIPETSQIDPNPQPNVQDVPEIELPMDEVVMPVVEPNIQATTQQPQQVANGLDEHGLPRTNLATSERATRSTKAMRRAMSRMGRSRNRRAKQPKRSDKHCGVNRHSANSVDSAEPTVYRRPERLRLHARLERLNLAKYFECIFELLNVEDGSIPIEDLMRRMATPFESNCGLKALTDIATGRWLQIEHRRKRNNRNREITGFTRIRS